MSKVLIVYATTDGHTRKIAQAVSDYVAEFGHAPYVVDAATAPRLARADAWDAVIALAPVRVGKHVKSMAAFARANVERLTHLPTAFFSVSLSAAGRDTAAARACADAFVRDTGWRPGMVRLVAGALLYTRYNWFVKRMMRRISRAHGGDTDITRDFEYTDWQQLRADVEEFVLGAVPAPNARDRVLAVTT